MLLRQNDIFKFLAVYATPIPVSYAFGVYLVIIKSLIGQKPMTPPPIGRRIRLF